MLKAFRHAVWHRPICMATAKLAVDAATAQTARLLAQQREHMYGGGCRLSCMLPLACNGATCHLAPLTWR